MLLSVTYRYIVGIDVSKKKLNLVLLDRKTTVFQELEVANTSKGFARIGRWLDSHKAGHAETLLCSEHTGRYGEHLLAWSTRQHWPHAVLSTRTLEKTGPEHHRKSDRYDARQLAIYGSKNSEQVRLSKAPRPVVRQLRRLHAERRDLVAQRARLKQKHGEADYHEANMESIKQLWQEQMDLLSEHIDQLKEQIEQLIREDDALNERYQLMRTAPGIGPVIGTYWLCLFAGQPELNARRISSRFGFAPHAHDSGSSVNKPPRSARYGNATMRSYMHQAARSVSTHKAHYKAYLERMTEEEGKPELLVINNIINKLIRLYCSMWNNQTEYDPKYMEKMKKKYKKSA